MKIGLRIDVDTYRGTKIGVPALCSILAAENIKASFFFSVGPDNMGRHLWRLLKPAFLWKMLRTDAAGLYGLDIIFMGTCWPGPLIGKNLKNVIKDAADKGHEIGLHAWDHQGWQAKIDKMTSETIQKALKKGCEELSAIIGKPVSCSAVPGWKSNDTVLEEKAKFPFTYNSDTRGSNIFYPVVNGTPLKQPQVPVTMPTYDEILGRNGVTKENYNDRMLSFIKQEGLNVLTIHAEAEGISCADMFKDFIRKAKAKGAEFVPLGELVRSTTDIPNLKAVKNEIPGREGWVSCQENAKF